MESKVWDTKKKIPIVVSDSRKCRASRGGARELSRGMKSGRDQRSNERRAVQKTTGKIGGGKDEDYRGVIFENVGRDGD